MSIRVHEYVKQRGITFAELKKDLASVGVEIKNGLSTISDEDLAKLTAPSPPADETAEVKTFSPPAPVEADEAQPKPAAPEIEPEPPVTNPKSMSKGEFIRWLMERYPFANKVYYRMDEGGEWLPVPGTSTKRQVAEVWASYKDGTITLTNGRPMFCHHVCLGENATRNPTCYSDTRMGVVSHPNGYHDLDF